MNKLKFKQHGLVQYNCCRLKTIQHPSKSILDNYRGYLCLFSFQKRKQTESAKLIRDADIQKELSSSTEIEGESKEERGIRKALVKEMLSGKSQVA